MGHPTRFAGKLAGVILVSVLALAGLTACSTARSGSVDQDLLVISNVTALDCSSDSATREANAANLQATADFVSNASDKQTADILALEGNEDLTDLTALEAALTAQTTACTSDAKSADDTSIVMSPELRALLDAGNTPLDQYACTTIVANTGGTVIDGTYTLFVNTILEVDPNNADLRKWSDALSTVLKGSTKEEMRDWLERAICEEPVIGISLAHLFAHLEIGGTSVLSLQSTDWLEFANVDASEINDLVAQYTPLTVWHLENLGSSEDAPEEVYQAAYQANHDYQKIASKLIYLLSRYELGTVTSINSTHHYHLVAGGLTADGIPEVEVSHEVDSRDSLVFYLTEKTACKPISVLAFNTGDKRPMLGSIPETCEPLQPKPETPSTECTSNCGPTDTCTENCGPTTCTVNCGSDTCYDDCEKDWNDNVTPPEGVTPSGPGELETRPGPVETPAPVQPEDHTPDSGQQAPGAETPTTPRETPPPATGSGGGSVNPSPAPSSTQPPTNDGTITNPFG